MTIFIFANNPKINKETIDKLKIKESDIFVLQNKSLAWEHLKDFKSQKRIIMLRASHNSYHGIDEFLKNKESYDKVIAVGRPIFKEYENMYEVLFKDISSMLITFDNNFITDENNINIPASYPLPKFASTGYLAYHYMKNKYPEENIVLVKFTGYADATEQAKSMASVHDHIYEQNYYKAKEVTIIN
jgi:hypothetical protein